MSIIGTPGAVTDVQNLITRDFRPGHAHTNIYEAIGQYITDHLAQPGEPSTTLQRMREAYRHNTFPGYVGRASVPAELEDDLVAYFIQFWFERGVGRGIGNWPVTRVGIITRTIDGKSDQVNANVRIYQNRSTHIMDHIVWFVHDPQADTWATLTPAQVVPAAANTQPLFGLDENEAAAPTLQLPFRPPPARNDSIVLNPPANNRPINRLPPVTTPSYTGYAPSAGATGATGAGGGYGYPSLVISRPFGYGYTPTTPQGQTNSFRPFVPPQQINSANTANQTPASTTPAQPPQVCNQPANTRAPTGHLEGAPHYDTELPWDLLADCTLQELIVYYPNHVFHYPGLALLFAHYTHRIVGELWTHTGTSHLIQQARGIKKNLTPNIMFWIRATLRSLDKDYEMPEYYHYQALYRLVASQPISNVSELLQGMLQWRPSRSRPAARVPLHIVGANVRQHPQGNFAARVQAAMAARNNGDLTHDEDANPPQVAPSTLHPMIDLLGDYTTDWDSRRREDTYTRNQGATEDRFIRPVEYFKTNGEDGERVYKKLSRDPSGQIWEIFDEDQTVFERLQANGWTREEFVRNHWRDVQRDALLWLDVGVGVNDWYLWLPDAALKEFKILDAPNPEAKKKAIVNYQGRMRKAKQRAIEGRLKNVENSQWLRTGPSDDSQVPQNKRLYQAEKKRWDEWVLANQDKRVRSKRRRDDDNDEGDQINDNARPSKIRRPEDTMFPRTHDNRNLYAGSFYVPRAHSGIGPVPQWWRDLRVDLLNRWFGNTSSSNGHWDVWFDIGIDVVPNPDVPRELLELPGDFSIFNQPPAQQPSTSLPAPAVPATADPGAMEFEFDAAPYGTPLVNGQDFGPLFPDTTPAFDPNSVPAVDPIAQQPNGDWFNRFLSGDAIDTSGDQEMLDLDLDGFDFSGADVDFAEWDADTAAEQAGRSQSSGSNGSQQSLRRSPRNHAGSRRSSGSEGAQTSRRRSLRNNSNASSNGSRVATGLTPPRRSPRNHPSSSPTR